MDKTLAHVVAEYPLLQPAVEVPDVARYPEAVVTVEQLGSPDSLALAIAASAERYQLGDKHAAQVWWFSLAHSLTRPAITAMVEFFVVPSLDLDRGTLFHRVGDAGLDPYWCGFRPGALNECAHGSAGEGLVQEVLKALPGREVLDAVARERDAWDLDEEEFAQLVGCAQSAQQLVRSIRPLLESLCAASGLRPAPLWAVLGDSLIAHAADSGNESFDPQRGYLVAQALYAGMADVMPRPRFEVVRDGQLLALAAPSADDDTAAGEDAGVPAATNAARVMASVSGGGGIDPDDHLFARRASCCMIYHSPTAEKCTSCPKHTPQERSQRLLSYVASL
ncbi:(2Fe-2S)-binding protein [Corynebacterium sp. 13CS0277]|uniref:(2Fe-2S)-binding protein n=1 Tax=Corynebacterium sp. 13CS0277 TaxID=2071994 RepID=UPI0011B1E36B|nr:(2Fe-2S)-binding protein [Corynebacterium sp. 13CS0277]